MPASKKSTKKKRPTVARAKAPAAKSTRVTTTRRAAKPEPSAGISSEAVAAATGRTWAQWVALLNREGAVHMAHADIAKHLSAKHGVPSWWSQMVTVGYERITRGREVGETTTGWQASRSKTVAVPVTRLYKAWSDPKVRAKWCPEKNLVVRTATA